MKKFLLSSVFVVTSALLAICGGDSDVVESSSSAKQSCISEDVAEEKQFGYYEDNCPAGHNCKYAAPTATHVQKEPREVSLASPSQAD